MALEALSLYDNFNSSLINPTKWDGSASDVLEAHRYIVFPVAGDGELRLEARGYGFKASPGANQSRSSTNRLRFRRLDPNAIRAIRATVKVNSAVAAGCPTTGSDNTQARFRMGGYFFNAGAGEPGRATDDVLARIQVRRLSNNTVANQLDIAGYVYRCLDVDCYYGQTLFYQQLGTMLVGQTATLLLQWDPVGNQFRFQLSANPVVAYTYSLPDTAPPQNFWDKKYIEVGGWIPNCTAAQSQAFMSVNVDDVYLNSAAVLAPAAPTLETLDSYRSDVAPAEGELVGPEVRD